jgi:hypothetical protein
MGHLVPKHFHHSNESLLTSAFFTAPTTTPSPSKHQSFVFMDLPILDISYKWNHDK